VVVPASVGILHPHRIAVGPVALILSAPTLAPEDILENTASRLWKRLPREERLLAAQQFWREPPTDLAATALAAVVRVRHVRPQVARSMPPDEQARAVASLSDPGEPLAAGLLVSLHLGARRSLLVTFLDALGLPHENGILKDDDDSPALGEEAARKAVAALLAAHPRDQVETYLNTLWLQDPVRWEVLEKSAGWP
jgi:hypothetical protein